MPEFEHGLAAVSRWLIPDGHVSRSRFPVRDSGFRVDLKSIKPNPVHEMELFQQHITDGS